MPLYEYSCADCQTQVELFRTLSGQIAPICPGCGGVLVRVITVPAIRGETVSKA